MVLQNQLGVGSIIMWYGNLANVPVGWQVCDGTNGTPNLFDTFIMGAGASAAVGQFGGANLLNVNTNVSGGHVHSGTTNPGGEHDHGSNTGSTALTIEQIPSHRHTLENVVALRAGGGQALHEKFETNRTTSTLTGNTGGGQGHRHSISNQEAHVHTFETNSRGEHFHQYTVDNRPKWCALYFIMKVAAVIV